MPYFVTLDNTKLYYEEFGQGKPIVFVHGMSGNCKGFYPIIDGLKGEYRCITYDQRGHGASSVTEKGLTLDQLGRDLMELIEYLGLEDIAIMGHSMGVATIFSYVEQFGCRHLSEALLADMTPKMVNDAEWNLGVTGYTIDDFFRYMDMLFQDAGYWLLDFRRWHDPEYMKTLPKEEEPSFTAGIMQGNTHHVMAALWYSLCRKDYRNTLSKISIPIACFCPVPGSLFLPPVNRYVADHVSGPSKLIEFEGCDHAFVGVEPERWAQEIKAFIQEVSPSKIQYEPHKYDD